jgi:hypothetical protein
MVESLRRGEAVEVDLDVFEAEDTGVCMCFFCNCIRDRIPEARARGLSEVHITLSDEILNDPEKLALIR